MKNLIFTLSVVFFLGSSFNIFAQRNANQAKFKSSANKRDYNDNYQILNDELQQGFFELDEANYSQTFQCPGEHEPSIEQGIFLQLAGNFRGDTGNFQFDGKRMQYKRDRRINLYIPDWSTYSWFGIGFTCPYCCAK